MLAGRAATGIEPGISSQIFSGEPGHHSVPPSRKTFATGTIPVKISAICQKIQENRPNWKEKTSSRFSRNFIGSRPKHSSNFSKMDASKKPKITSFFVRAKHIFLASLRELRKIVYTFVFLGSFALLNFLVHFYVTILFYYI